MKRFQNSPCFKFVQTSTTGLFMKIVENFMGFQNLLLQFREALYDEDIRNVLYFIY